MLDGLKIGIANRFGKNSFTIHFIILLIISTQIIAQTHSAHSSATGEHSLFGMYLAGQFAHSVGDSASASNYYEGLLDKDPGNKRFLARAFLTT